MASKFGGMKFNGQSKLSKGSGKRIGDSAAILGLFLIAIIGITFLSSIGDDVQGATQTITVNNDTVTLPSSVGGTLELTGRDLVSTTSIINQTGVDLTGNVSLSDGLGSDGTKTVILTLDGLLIDGEEINGTSANVSYVANPDGSVQGSNATIIDLVVLIGALAILVLVIVVLIKKGYLGKLISGRL